jgi:hypothetical protein
MPRQHLGYTAQHHAPTSPQAPRISKPHHDTPLASEQPLSMQSVAVSFYNCNTLGGVQVTLNQEQAPA